MKKERNSDKLFREKIQDFSVSPPPHVWDNVKATLATLKRKRRMIYISWISAAAVVLLAFIGGWYFNETQVKDNAFTIQTDSLKTENDKIENIENSMPNKTTLASSEENKKELKKNEIVSISNIKEENLLVSATGKSFENQTVDDITFVKDIVALVSLETVDPKFTTREDLTLHTQKTKSDFSTELSEHEKNIVAGNVINLKNSVQKNASWKMGMSISPGYSSHVANHSDSYAQNMNYSGNNGNANVSGGLSVQYKTKKRWSLESGVYYAQNGQKSETSFELFALNQNADAIFSSNEDTYFSNAVNVNNGKMEMNSTAGVIAFNGTPKGAEVSADFDELRLGVANSLVSSGEFSQVFEFVEIPLFVRYRLVDSKFGVELLGGFNAGIVVGNDAYIDNEYGLQNVGKTEDISPLNISGTLGLGLNYALGKHFSLAIEPRFNYYLSSINNNPNVDFRPYRIGFYTGVYYEF